MAPHRATAHLLLTTRAVNVREGVALCSCCLDFSDDEAIRRVPPRAHIDVKILTDYSDSGVAGVAGVPGVGTEDLAAGLTKFACQSLEAAGLVVEGVRDPCDLVI